MASSNTICRIGVFYDGSFFAYAQRYYYRERGRDLGWLRFSRFTRSAAHIKRFTDKGPHEVRNGVLLRADLHRLFDKGYVTITSDSRFEVSSHLKQDFENGRSYYLLHGQRLEQPVQVQHRPATEFVQWHNTRVYLG